MIAACIWGNFSHLFHSLRFTKKQLVSQEQNVQRATIHLYSGHKSDEHKQNPRHLLQNCHYLQLWVQSHQHTTVKQTDPCS